MIELNVNELQEVSGGDNDENACYYNGEKYSDGAKIVHSDGSTQTCQGGSWQ